MTMLRKRMVAGAIALALQSGLVQAADVVRVVGNTQITIPILKGHCLLEEQNTRDSAFVKGFGKSMDELIATAMDCDNRDRWRMSAGVIPHYSLYFFGKASQGQIWQGDKSSARRKLCGLARKMGNATSGPFDSLAKAAKEMNENNAARSANLGLIGEDEHACYVATLEMSHKDYALILGISAATVIHQRVVTLLIFQEYQGAETFQQSLEEAKAWGAQVDESNP
jgi:hypothetical protein